MVHPANIKYKDENVKMSVIITLAQEDFEAILLNPHLASTADTTFVSFGSSFIRDTAGNQVNAISGAAVSIFGTVQESAILTFVLDMNKVRVSLTLSRLREGGG